MTVYVVMTGTGDHYDPDTVRGIYSTEAKAREAIAAWPSEAHRPRFRIEPREIDKELE